MTGFDIPQTPWELIARQRNIVRRLWNREYDLANPVISIGWPYEFDSAIGTIKDFGFFTEPFRRVEDPEFDVFCQLESVRHQIECLEASTEVGHVLANVPAFDLIHFGTGPLATAFGSRMILREDLQPAFEPAVHSPEAICPIGRAVAGLGIFRPVNWKTAQKHKNTVIVCLPTRAVKARRGRPWPP